MEQDHATSLSGTEDNAVALVVEETVVHEENDPVEGDVEHESQADDDKPEEVKEDEPESKPVPVPEHVSSSKQKYDSDVAANNNNNNNHSEEDSKEEDGYQSENESDEGTDNSHERLRKKDEAGYEEEDEDDEPESESDISSQRGKIRSDGYEEEDTNGSESEPDVVIENEEEDADLSQGKDKDDDEEEEGDEKGAKKSPSFVPRRTDFWDHDDRFEDVAVDESRPRTDPKKKLWEKTSDRWSHDMFKEDEQGPKEAWELEESRKEADYLNTRRGRGRRGGTRLGEFVPRLRQGDREKTDGERPFRDGRGAGPRRGRRGRGGRRGGGQFQEYHYVEDTTQFERSEERSNTDIGEGRRKGEEREREIPVPKGEIVSERTTGSKSGKLEGGSDPVRREEQRPQRSQRERGYDVKRDIKPQHDREEVRKGRSTKKRPPPGDGIERHRDGETEIEKLTHGYERSSRGYKTKGWGDESDDESEDKENNLRRERPRDGARRPGRNSERRPGEEEIRQQGIDGGPRRTRRESDSHSKGERNDKSNQKQRGRGRGIMSDTITKGNKTADDFRKERSTRRRSGREFDEEDREQDEDGSRFEDEKYEAEAAKPASKPKRYSSQRQRQVGKEDGGPAETIHEDQTEAAENFGGGIQYNPQLLAYIQHQLQQQQQSAQQAMNSDGGTKGVSQATVQLLQQHILQMQQQLQQLQMQNVVLRRQQLEQEQHQQHHHQQQQQQQQMFAPGIPPLVNQQDPNMQASALRAAQGMAGPGILYSVMQGMPPLPPRPPQHQPQQLPEATLVYPDGGAQQQQMLLNQQMAARMYNPGHSGLFVPPPHMQQPQHPPAGQQTDENVDMTQPRKPRSAAIPIKPPPEVAR